MFKFYLMTPLPLNCTLKVLARGPIGLIFLYFFLVYIFTRGNYIRNPELNGEIDEENKKWYEVRLVLHLSPFSLFI